MVLHKRKKFSRQRGGNSHGWGHKKKHRGAGHRGGVGRAGTGARADTKKPTILSKIGKTYFGKRGFVSRESKKRNLLSLSQIEENFDVFLERKEIEKNEKGEYVFDTTRKYDKILSGNNFTQKINLTVKEISKSAKKKVEDLGGKVVSK